MAVSKYLRSVFKRILMCSLFVLILVGLLTPLWGAGSVAPLVGEPEAHFVVAADGSGDFTSVQEAVMAIPDLRKEATIVVIRPGTYKEKLVLPASKTNVVFWGSNPQDVVLTYDDFAQKPNVFGEEV